MKNVFMLAEQIYLRPLEESDLDGDYLKWINDPEITVFMSTGLFPQNSKMLRSFWESVSEDSSSINFAIVDKKTDKHIGNAKVDRIDWINRTCEFGILIGDKTFWSKGICKEVLALLVDYSFGR